MGLGELLVGRGVIDNATLQAAASLGRERGLPLSKALVELGAVTEAQIVGAIAAQLGLPFADTSPGAVDPDAAALLPGDVAAELTALPVAFAGNDGLVVALADPHNVAALERVSALTGLRARPALAVRADLLRAITHLTGGDGRDARPAPPADAGPRLLAYEQEETLDLSAVLTDLTRIGGSDLHLTSGLPPTVRVDGELMPLAGYPALTPDELRKTIYGILTQRQRETFENSLELDVSHSVPGLARFRVNVFQQRDAIGSVMRVIPHEIKPLDRLGVPAHVPSFAYLTRGFVLVTGPTGSGKSTTLAALLDLINRERACHIMTVEDPIEFLHQHKRAVVNQRELGSDTHSFAAALKHVLRQDPDVILVGELRDLETIQVALTAAETGHLVFGTLHTQDAPQTIDRIIDVFPPHQQEQIRVMLAGALQGVLCQQLLRTREERGRVAACELMVATPAIRNLIREGKTHQMYSSIQAGKQHGMVAMDQSLSTLVTTGRVTYEAALERCTSVADFNRLCGRA
jgi:twitching motility protein PilT